MESPFGIGYNNSGESAGGKLPSFAPFVQGRTQLSPVVRRKEKGDDDKMMERQVLLIESGNDSASPQSESISVKHESVNDSAAMQPQVVQKRAEEGRLRAQAILRRFQQQQDTLLLQLAVPKASATTTASSVEPSSAYVEQRRKAAVREKRLFQEALRKNFAYLAAKQQTESQQLANQIAEAQQREMEADQHYQRMLAERKHKLQHKELQSQAGIGTQERKRAEATKSQIGHLPSAALYLTGIPVDGSVTAQFVRGIFQAYGTITKVHFYREKSTGDLKGDGLVVYEVASVQEKEELIRTVCTQMNGAELADGVVLHVEPAGSPEQSSTNVTEAQQVPETKGTEPLVDDNDEDLEDFFDSL